MLLLNKLETAIKELGFINFFLYRLDRFLNGISKGKIRLFKYFFFAQPITNQPLVKNPEKRKIKIFPSLKDDQIINQFPRTNRIIQYRFNQNSECYTAIKEGDFIGYIWISKDFYLEDEVKCKYIPTPKTKAVWDYDVYIKPENRLSLAFPMLWDYVNRLLSSQGYLWSMSRISAFNSNSINVHKKLGAQYVGQASFFCIGPVQILFSSISPFFNISIHSTPELLVPSP